MSGMTNRKRVSAGVPAGGEFSAHDRQEAEVQLRALEEEFSGRGGRGVDLAEQIDELRAKLYPTQDADEFNPEGYTHRAGSGETHNAGDIVDIDGVWFERVGEDWMSADDDSENRAALDWPIDAYDRTFVSSASEREMAP